MEYVNSVSEEGVSAFADALLFSKEAILKCLYWYGDKFHINVTLMSNHTYSISLKPIDALNFQKEELSMYLQKLQRDLIDYQLRDIITIETQNVRDLLVAKAFSNGEFDEPPTGEVSDPVGYNPIDIK